MLSFENDYLEGAHERVLQRLMETNRSQESGYGADRFSQQASEKIKEVIDCPEATVHFLVGGTQTNQVVIDTLLAAYEGVIAADTGHITTHEAGAIEYSGHKVLPLSSIDGKLEAAAIKEYLTTFYADANHTHMVFPGMVYLSFPTEYGTLYSYKELQEIAAVCQEFSIPLYLDGARLGYGLASEAADVTMADIAKFCDVFYIGGTKIGALFGEAVVFTKKNEPKQFTTQIKQHGALLAKSRVLGVQFLTLFSDGLYEQISRQAVQLAQKLKQGLVEKGYELYLDSPTNQQFFLLTNETINQLQKEVRFSLWEPYDAHHQIVRFATSWATTEEQIVELLALM